MQYYWKNDVLYQELFLAEKKWPVPAEFPSALML